GLGQNIGWMSRPGISAIIQFKLNLIEPFYYAATSVDPISIYPISIPLLLIITVAFLIFLVNWKQYDTGDKRVTYLLFIFIILPSLMAFAASRLLPYSIWGTRHLIVIFAPVSILLAIVLTKIPNVSVKTVAITLILLFSGYACVLQAGREKPDYVWCSWNDAASEFAASRNIESGEKLYAFEELTAYHLWFALRKTDAKIVLVKGTGVPEDKSYFLPRRFDGVEIIDEKQITDDRISLAFRAVEADVTKPPISNLVSQGYEIESVRPLSAGEIKVFLVSAWKKK
ncbi:MAG: hypothetical protein ABIP78_05280, partial [Pyrinomonadaceae bacterium]